MSFISICILAIVAAIFAVSFKNIKGEYGVLICVSVCILLFVYGVNKLSGIVEGINTIKSYISIDSTYINIIIKIIGISYITEFASDICRDCSYGALANQLQVFGKITVIAISFPVVINLFDTVGSILS